MWITQSRVFWKFELDEGRYRFMTIDGAAGESAAPEPAFDHEAAARLIGEVTGEAVDPDRLPVLTWGVGDGVLRGLLPGFEQVLVVRDGVLGVEPVAEGSAFLAEQTTRRRSGGNGESSQFVVRNQADFAVRLYWVDGGRGRHDYGVVEAGGERAIGTYAGHVWLVTAEDGREMGYYAAERGGSVVLLTGLEEPVEEGPRERPSWWRDRERDAVSPDGKAFVVMQTVPAEEHRVTIVRSSPEDQVQPKVMTFDYLKPGDRIAKPRPRLFRVAEDGSTERVAVSTELFDNPYWIAYLAWLPDSSAFTFIYNQRGHRVMRLVSVDGLTGEARAVIDEQPETFFDYAAKLYLHRFESSDELIWMSERDGWNHLYLIDERSGAVIRQLTKGSWVVRSVERVDEEARTVLIRAMGVYPDQDPYHVQYGRVDIDSGAVTWLTDGDGTHRIDFSPTGDYLIDRYSHAERPVVTELRCAADGGKVATLAEADTRLLVEEGWRGPERFVAKGRDGETDIWGVMWLPKDFDPSKRYPVIESIYAGPHGQHVVKDFRLNTGLSSLADLGFVVVSIDGMGTNWRSKAFHDVAWKNLGDSGFPDRIAWIKAAAATRPWMDIERVGIYGVSAGGQSALRALTVDAYSDFYKAAVADCGCHDNRMDKIWWNELWMSWPVGPHYEEQSNVTNAHRLRGDLLLMVGEVDRNVDPASTMQVVNELIKADKDFELLVMPNVGHGCLATEYGRRRMRDFFVRVLQGE